MYTKPGHPPRVVMVPRIYREYAWAGKTVVHEGIVGGGLYMIGRGFVKLSLQARRGPRAARRAITTTTTMRCPRPTDVPADMTCRLAAAAAAGHDSQGGDAGRLLRR